MEVTGLIIAGIVLLFIGFAIGFFMGLFYPENSESIAENKCDCKDVNQCDKWCIAKENYTKYHG